MHPSSNALKLITVFIMLFACHVLYGMGSGNEKSVTHEYLYQGSLRALVKRGTNHTVAIAAYKDYYPYGQLMPGRNYQTTDYRYGYQGQYAETDPETSFAHFEAREFDSRLGRWMVPDPAGQYWSPYLGMGNNPVSGVDPDGRRWFTNGTECEWFSGFMSFWNANFSSKWNLTPYDGSTTNWTGEWVKTSEPFVVHAPTWSTYDINPENGQMWVKGINSVPIEFFIIAPASLPFRTGITAIDFSLIALNPIGGLRGGAAKGADGIISKTLRVQKQVNEHIIGGKRLGTNSYLNSVDDATSVLNAAHSGKANVLSTNPGQNRVYVQYNNVTGYYNNNGVIIPTNKFLIKGGKSSTVVPIHPNSTTFK